MYDYYFAHAVNRKGLDIEPLNLIQANWAWYGTEDFLGVKQPQGLIGKLSGSYRS